VKAGAYYVRVVGSTVQSTRGSSSSYLGVPTFMTDASGGSAQPVTNKVGGNNPTLVDPGTAASGAVLNTATYAYAAGLTGTAQAVAPVTVSSAAITGIDFGYHFATVTNLNTSGPGSPRRSVTNANNLSDPATVSGRSPSATEHVIFMLSNGTDGNGLRATYNLYNTTATGAYARSVFTILPTAGLQISAKLVLDAQTQPGFSAYPIIELRGTSAGAGAVGLTVASTAGSSVIRGLVIGGYTSDGLAVAGASTTVQGNWIGLQADGLTARANGGNGINATALVQVDGSTATTMTNVIAGNTQAGILLASGASGSSVLRGNYVSLGADGTTLIPNGSQSVSIACSTTGTTCTLGGTTTAARNVIGGPTTGHCVYVTGLANITGNYIGTASDGRNDRGPVAATGDGINVASGASTATAISNNLVSGANYGINLAAALTTVRGNEVGTDSTGTATLPNRAAASMSMRPPRSGATRQAMAMSFRAIPGRASPPCGRGRHGPGQYDRAVLRQLGACQHRRGHFSPDRRELQRDDDRRGDRGCSQHHLGQWRCRHCGRRWGIESIDAIQRHLRQWRSRHRPRRGRGERQCNLRQQLRLRQQPYPLADHHVGDLRWHQPDDQRLGGRLERIEFLQRGKRRHLFRRQRQQRLWRGARLHRHRGRRQHRQFRNHRLRHQQHAAHDLLAGDGHHHRQFRQHLGVRREQGARRVRGQQPARRGRRQRHGQPLQDGQRCLHAAGGDHRVEPDQFGAPAGDQLCDSRVPHVDDLLQVHARLRAPHHRPIGPDRRPVSARSQQFGQRMDGQSRRRVSGASAGSGVSGLTVNAANVQIRGLIINGFTSSGINVATSGTSVILQGNWIGLARDGSTASANGTGLSIAGTGATVGGTATAAIRNVISANTGVGPRLDRRRRAPPASVPTTSVWPAMAAPPSATERIQSPWAARARPPASSSTT
jgi:hypothetical protein